MLHVHRSDRADELVARLAELVAVPLPDPMQAEVVSVPTRGIERWLTQRLSGQLGARAGRHDGVCANVVFPFPGVLVNRALAAASDADPDADPWVPNRAVWPLMELVEGHFDEEWLAPLAEHIRKSRTVEESKRFSSVRHVADLFDRYAVHRPDMLQRWADGTPQLGEGSEASWQVDLWLRLRDRIGPPSPAERLREACQKLRQNRSLVDLPDRFSLFGLTRLPSSYLDVLEALGASRDVHLFLLHPSPALWDRLQSEVGPASRQLFRREDPTAALANNPLLASWGRDAREMQLVLGGAVSHGRDPEEVVPGPRPLLRQIQEDIRADRLPVGDGGFGAATDPRPFLADDDDSITIHSCHGRSRQVEVLRDAILHELEADPELELRDVIIMCPDIENYAPLIEATFGARDRIGGHEDTTSQLEIRLADRALRRTNPLMGVLADVLDLAGARMTATQVIDLAGREPVRRRFRFSDDDLSRLEEWVRESHVRWGFDAEHREAFRLGGIGANTWRAGLDRILLGVAMADERERLFEGTAPLDDVDTGDIELAGRLAEFVERLRRATDDLGPLRTIDEWAKTLADISDSLSMPAAQDLWQRSQLTALLEEVVKEATTARGVSPVVLSCDDVRSILADRLKGQPTRANFRTGHLTVCTLVPMRSIPHKVVCLLGLDDGSFPRHIERDGDDLTALEPRVGDRDVRSEDRQLLLDALLAARERLIITYTGRDERSNLRRPPAVPVGELLDVVDRTVRVPEGTARAAITVTHPLQPFDARNYVPGALVAGRPWSFDTVHLDGARAARAPREAVAPFLSGPLPERSGPVSLDLLDRFVQHPVRVFLRERLGVSLFDRTRDFEDAIPLALNGLSAWEVGERMLRARLGGADWATCRAAEVARGGLPPGELAEPSLLDMEHDVEALVQASAAGQGGTAATAVAVDLELTGLPSLAGVVPGVRGDVLHLVTYRRMQPALRLAAWVQLLAATAAEPERPFSAVTIGRAEARSSRTVSTAEIAPLGPDPASRKRNAEAQLRRLLELFGLGMTQPLPLYCKTSAAYAAVRAAGADDADVAARQQWESSFERELEDKDRAHQLALGGLLSYNDMVSCSGPLGDDAGAGAPAFDPSERTRFGYYARLLWDGLLVHERVVFAVTARTSPEPFDVCGPLPTGMTLLEASAGTGKTFTIAALTTRYVAEMGKPIDRLLVITFTRMATGELRERVREHLVHAFDGLVAVLSGAAPPPDDEILRLLADAPRDVQEERRDRLAKAVADFDAATIETTHGFCLQVLYGLGTAGDVDRDVTLVEDVRDLMEEVVDDLYLRKFAHRPNEHGFTHAEAVTIARKVLDHPDARVLPAPSDGDDLNAVRARFAAAFAKEMERRKRARKIMTYDDVLLRLRETLRDPVRGPHARRRLRERYEVVLVDEFQDTDPVQWEIMQRAFGDHDTTLVLIGDPKQAIYAFRGADVQAYLQAKDAVASEWTLGENWRSDAPLLEAYDALFGNAQLGQGGIDYRSVRAAAANVEPRLLGVPVTTPLRVRLVHVADGLVGRTKEGLKAAEARAFIATDLAEQVVEMLSAGGEVVVRNRDGSEAERVPLHAGHIAVLVRSNTHAMVVRDALHDAGVSVVIGGAGSVFVSDAARDWLRLLEALERPAARDRAALTALTRFVGWTAEQVALADEDQWEELHWSLHRWAALLRDKGIAALGETVSAERSVPERVLAGPNGERFMTDLRHVVQLLHAAGATEGVGPTAMANWLGRRIREADRDSENEERTRRLESDARAVQVITIHRSKGLEFPIVLYPYAWDGYIHKIGVPVFHDPDHDHARTVDVGGPGRELDQHRKLEKVEGQGEALRLFYVALTRAQHQVVLWWAKGWDTGDSPLSRLLFDRAPAGEVAPYGMKKARPDDEVEAACAALGPHVSVERVAAPSGARLHEQPGGAGELSAAVFDRTLDAAWRRVSYSGITRDAHEAPAIGSEPEDEGTTDEPASDVSIASRTPAASDPAPVALGLADMPGGTLVGTIVHEVLQRTVFDASDLSGELDGALERELTRRNADLGNRADVIAGLRSAIESPLGPLVGDVRLADVARAQRLDELGFEFPLVGGEAADPSQRLDVADVADLLDAHLEPEDPVRAYAARLREPTLDGLLRGYLNGSLDLVFRHDGRFFLADYKTNKLCGPEETLTSWHYRPDALQAEMRLAHYPLQALLYSVALHRYLRWRLPDYEVDRHFGGVLYLFLRGMSAVERVRADGHPCGVWSWRPPSALLEALSDLFDEGRRA